MDGPDRPANSRTDSVVELVGVRKVYRQRQRSERLADVLTNLFRPTVREVEALRGIDLRIDRGEIVAYAGPNGAGKSTTVKLCSSLLSPDAGTVRVLGMDPVRERARCDGRLGVAIGPLTDRWWDDPEGACVEW
jgi:ABC-2 type transport system ATP-binding protein